MAYSEDNKRLADYAMTFDLIGDLTGYTTEEKAIDRILDLCIMLFGPASLAYMPMVGGMPGDVTARPASLADDEELKRRLMSFADDYAWTDSGDGFILRIGNKEETFGILLVDGLAFPEYKQHSLNLALTLVKVLTLSISNARNYQRLADTKSILQKERDRIQTYLDVAGVMLVVIDADQKVSLINKKGREILGYGEEEIIGRDWFDNFLPEREREKTRAYFRQIVSGEAGVVQSFENPVLTKSGRERIIMWQNTMLRDEEGEIYATLSSGEDITERKKAEEALRESEARFRSIVDSANDAIVLCDSSGNTTYWNKAAEKIFGFSADEVIGRSLDMIMPERYREDHRRSMEKRVKHPEIESSVIGKTVELAGLRKDGSEFPLELSLAMWGTKQGLFFTGIMRDITDRKKAEEDLRRAYEELEMRVEERTAELAESNMRLSQEISERKQAEEKIKVAKELSEALNDINALISSTLDFEEIIEKVITDGARAIGAEAAVLSLREDNLWAVKKVYDLPVGLLGSRYSDDEAPVSTLAASLKRPVAISDVFHDYRVNAGLMKNLGARSVLAAPLSIKETTIGVMVFIYRSGSHDFTREQIDFANKLAISIALAIENARLYEAERNIADTLQSALLVMPQRMQGLDFGYLYRSATEMVKVGGDFYDVFEIEYGKIGITVGDVSGKGLEAATLTSLVKNTIKAYAYDGESVASIMQKTNDAVYKASVKAYFITVFFGVLDIKTGNFTYCSAGHPPAMLRRDHAVSLLFTGSPFIGAFPSLIYTENSVTLKKGDSLILYTDGLIEARRNDLFFGDERLEELVGQLADISISDIPKAIFDEVMKFTGGRLLDDVALLAVGLSDETANTQNKAA